MQDFSWATSMSVNDRKQRTRNLYLVMLCQGQNREKMRLIFIDYQLWDEILYVILLKSLLRRNL